MRTLLFSLAVLLATVALTCTAFAESPDHNQRDRDRLERANPASLCDPIVDPGCSEVVPEDAATEEEERTARRDNPFATSTAPKADEDNPFVNEPPEYATDPLGPAGEDGTAEEVDEDPDHMDIGMHPILQKGPSDPAMEPSNPALDVAGSGNKGDTSHLDIGLHSAIAKKPSDPAMAPGNPASDVTGSGNNGDPAYRHIGMHRFIQKRFDGAMDPINPADDVAGSGNTGDAEHRHIGMNQAIQKPKDLALDPINPANDEKMRPEFERPERMGSDMFDHVKRGGLR